MDFFFFQAEDGIRDGHVTGVQTCALPISASRNLSIPCLAKISAIEIPNFAATISSVSNRSRPIRRWRHRPTEDLPAPIMPMSTIDFPRRVTWQYRQGRAISKLPLPTAVGEPPLLER